MILGVGNDTAQTKVRWGRAASVPWKSRRPAQIHVASLLRLLAENGRYGSAMLNASKTDSQADQIFSAFSILHTSRRSGISAITC
jgi:hypothetical protein